MTYKSEIGKFGEDFACEYLVEKGYKIIERNFRKPYGELDIIIMAPDKTLVFIEVKTVRGVKQQTSDTISAEEQLTMAKLKKLQKTASLYANHRIELINDKKGWRIDLLALTIIDKSVLVNHYENI
ncbi:MAG: YraN family protein [Patescibacteria group bacterium]